jgi:hypothetical protein
MKTYKKTYKTLTVSNPDELAEAKNTITKADVIEITGEWDEVPIDFSVGRVVVYSTGKVGRVVVPFNVPVLRPA